MSQNWTFIIEDTSSFITYLPHGDGGSGDLTSIGWQPWFSDWGYNSYRGQQATGWSLHKTALNNASLSFSFFGSSLALYGEAECSFTIRIDDNAVELGPKNGPLFSTDALPLATHHVTLTADASSDGMFTFDRAVIGHPVPDGLLTATVYQATNSPIIHYDGSWEIIDDPDSGIPSNEDPAPFYRASTAPATFSVLFDGVGVAVNGARNWDTGIYHVNLDGVETSYNESTQWLIGDALLFYQDGLDPTQKHNLTVRADVGDGIKFRLNSVTVFASNTSVPNSSIPGSGASDPMTSASATPTSHSKSDVSVVAGSVVAVLTVILGMMAFLFWFIRRRTIRTKAEDAAQMRTSYVVIGPPTTPSDIHSPPPPFEVKDTTKPMLMSAEYAAILPPFSPVSTLRISHYTTTVSTVGPSTAPSISSRDSERISMATIAPMPVNTPEPSVVGAYSTPDCGEGRSLQSLPSTLRPRPLPEIPPDGPPPEYRA